MSTTTTTLLSLPTEILHWIFDELDIKTLFLSVGLTCKQLHLAARTYNRLKLDFISKQNLSSVCQALAPENVFSLTVTYDNDHFTTNDLGFFIDNLRQFTCLRTLSYVVYNEAELNMLLDFLSTSQIMTLEIYIRNRQNSSKSEFSPVSTLSQSNKSIDTRLVKYSTLQCLSLKDCTHEQLSWIMRYFPDLQKLDIPFMDENEAKQTPQTLSISMLYLNLTTFKLNCSTMSTDNLEILLSCMPSLLRLDLKATVRSVNLLFDASFLKKLISNKLPRLQDFTCYFMSIPDNYGQLESLIVPFRTPFWYEEKRWFFSCTWFACFPRVRIILQCPSLELQGFGNVDEEDYFSLFNIPVSVNGKIKIETVRHVSLRLSSLMSMAHQTEVRDKLICIFIEFGIASIFVVYISFSKIGSRVQVVVDYFIKIQQQTLQFKFITFFFNYRQIMQTITTLAIQLLLCFLLMTNGNTIGSSLFYHLWNLTILHICLWSLVVIDIPLLQKQWITSKFYLTEHVM